MQQFERECFPPKASGQVARVLNRFAVIAAAGEAATKMGITGWQDLPIACWVMKIKMAIFVGNSGNEGTLLSFISICSHVPHERTLIWDKYEHTNLLIFNGLKNLFPGSRSSHAKQPIEK